jgi:hypothetical protein
VSVQRVEPRTGHGGADGVGGRVQDEDRGNRLFDVPFEPAPGLAEARVLSGNIGDLAGVRLSRAASISEHAAETTNAINTLMMNTAM